MELLFICIFSMLIACYIEILIKNYDKSKQTFVLSNVSGCFSFQLLFSRLISSYLLSSIILKPMIEHGVSFSVILIPIAISGLLFSSLY